MKIIISDRAEVYDERAHALDTNPETLRKLSGLACTEGEMSYFIGDGSDEGRSRTSHPEVLKMLLGRNADVNLQDSTGRSALIIRKRSGNDQVPP